MPKIDEKVRMIHLSSSAVIDRPMVLIPIDEYEELIEDAEAIASKSLTKQIDEARKRFKQGKGRSLAVKDRAS